MFDFSRRASSTASSIFDMSQEAEQLDRAIKEDNVNIVKKFLEVYLNKFNMLNLHGSFQLSYGDSGGSRRVSQVSHHSDARRCSSCMTQDSGNNRHQTHDVVTQSTISVPQQPTLQVHSGGDLLNQTVIARSSKHNAPTVFQGPPANTNGSINGLLSPMAAHETASSAAERRESSTTENTEHMQKSTYIQKCSPCCNTA